MTRAIHLVYLVSPRTDKLLESCTWRELCVFNPSSDEEPGSYFRGKRDLLFVRDASWEVLWPASCTGSGPPPPGWTFHATECSSNDYLRRLWEKFGGALEPSGHFVKPPLAQESFLGMFAPPGYDAAQPVMVRPMCARGWLDVRPEARSVTLKIGREEPRHLSLATVNQSVTVLFGSLKRPRTSSESFLVSGNLEPFKVPDDGNVLMSAVTGLVLSESMDDVLCRVVDGYALQGEVRTFVYSGNTFVGELSDLSKLAVSPQHTYVAVVGHEAETIAIACFTLGAGAGAGADADADADADAAPAVPTPQKHPDARRVLDFTEDDQTPIPANFFHPFLPSPPRELIHLDTSDAKEIGQDFREPFNELTRAWGLGISLPTERVHERTHIMDAILRSLDELNQFHIGLEGAKTMFTFLERMFHPGDRYNVFPVFHSRVVVDVNDEQWFLVFFFDKTRLNEDSATWMSAHMLKDMKLDFLARFRCTNVYRDHQMDVGDMVAGAPYPGWNQLSNKLGFMQNVPPPIQDVITNASAKRPKNIPKVTSDHCGFWELGCRQVLGGNGCSSAKVQGNRDHVVAITNFGLNEKFNVRMICSVCHNVKTFTEAKHFPKKSSPVELSFLATQVLMSAALKFNEHPKHVAFQGLGRYYSKLEHIKMSKVFLPPNVTPVATPNKTEIPRSEVRDLGFFLKHFDLEFIDYNGKKIGFDDIEERKDFYDSDAKPMVPS
jgi:hypothetical protein